MTEPMTEPPAEQPEGNESVEGPGDTPLEADQPLDPEEGRLSAEEDDGSEALEHGGGGNG